MVVEELTDQWICSCGNWVDQAFDWCPDCCDNKVPKRRRRRKPRRVHIRDSLIGLKVGEPSFPPPLHPLLSRMGAYHVRLSNTSSGRGARRDAR